MKKHPWQTSYKVTNWSDYNRALINRGDLTLWVSDDVIEVWIQARQTGSSHEDCHEHVSSFPSPACPCRQKEVLWGVDVLQFCQ